MITFAPCGEASLCHPRVASSGAAGSRVHRVPMYTSNDSFSTITSEERNDRGIVERIVATIVLEELLVQDEITRPATPATKNIFSLNVASLPQVGGALAPPLGGVTARRWPLCEANSEQSSGGGRLAPSPASHHVGVGGGGWNHHLTPTRCEAGRGVVSHV